MTDQLLQSSFAKQLNDIGDFIAGNWAWPSPDSGFALLVLTSTSDRRYIPATSTLSWPSSGELRQAQILAASGYLLAQTPAPTVQQISDFTGALDLLSRRDAFPLDRQSFAFRPVEVVGIALGLAGCRSVDAEVKGRIQSVMSRLPTEGNQDEWSAVLYGVASEILGLPVKYRPPLDINRSSASTLATLKWLAQYRPDSWGNTFDIKALDEQLLQKAATGTLDADDIARASVIRASLKNAVSERIASRLRDTWPVNREAQDAILVAEQICRRFHLFAKQLQHRRHDVDNPSGAKKLARPTIEMRDEYDVQDSLHALLRLHFDDVRDEEWTPSYAGGQSRMDFVLQREKIVIETKYMGPRLTQNEVAKQLAIDEKYYRQHQKCQTLICLIYDPHGRCDNPVALESDASNTDHGFRTLVIVCPHGV